LIPPGGVFDFRCEFVAQLPGPVSAEIELFLVEEDIREVKLKVSAQAFKLGGDDDPFKP
jgi:hypothetical protein